MNCRECQRDLSPCLDGRLPSGRRTAVTQHLEDCEECTQLWREMQQAQELVLRLPRHPVSPGFHTRLWDRIKAGEGTPEAVFSEPMPLVTKARYVLTGAAAAALMLVFLNGWASPTGGGQDIVDPGEPPIVGQFTGDPMPLIPPALAQQAARVVADDYRALSRNFQMLQRQPQDQLDETTLSEIRSHARAVKTMGRVLLWLQSDQHVELPRDMEVKLRLAGSSIDMDRLGSMRNSRELQATLSTVIRELQSLDQLPRLMMVRTVYRPEEELDFQRQAAEWFVEQREPLDYLHIQVSGRPGILHLEVLDEDRIKLSTGSSVPNGGAARFLFIPAQKQKR